MYSLYFFTEKECKDVFRHFNEGFDPEVRDRCFSVIHNCKFRDKVSNIFCLNIYYPKIKLSDHIDWFSIKNVEHISYIDIYKLMVDEFYFAESDGWTYQNTYRIAALKNLANLKMIIDNTIKRGTLKLTI